MVSNLKLKWIVIGSMSLLAAGCLPAYWHYGPDNQTLDEFKQRVENTFRLQNSLTSEIMLLQEGSEPYKDQQSILEAEQNMQKNCSDLNEYAARDIDGERASLLLRHRVEHSLLECEHATRKVEELLKGR